MNDPNGLCFWKGNWHLFYQAYPPEDPRQHWGMRLVKTLSTGRIYHMLYTQILKMLLSGSTLVEEDRVIAMYHGTKVGNMIAVSKKIHYY